MLYTIIDIETTGGQPSQDKITEIAMVKHDGTRIIDEYSTLLNPNRPITWYVSKLTGITDEMVAKAPQFYEVARKIVEFTEGCIFVAHNVRFDYSFIKKEFHALGFNFHRKRLCTVRLGRKLIPGQPSYSLGTLCQNLGIEITDRHRALGDAKATAVLFEMMLRRHDEKALIPYLEDEIKASLVPSQIPNNLINRLPEETGVYFFHDADGKIIYIGKSTNIRKRVIQHFAIDLNSKKEMELKNSIADIDYQITGSELVALLLESDLIKKLKPIMNRAQRRSVFPYGLFSSKDENGYITFEVKRISENAQPLTQLGTALAAKSFLQHFTSELGLCQKLNHLYKTQTCCFEYTVHQCKGACIGQEPVEEYNARAKMLINRYAFKHPNFIIVGKGRNTDEQSVVFVENSIYKGFGFIDKTQPADWQTLKDCIQYRMDNKDIQQILRQHLKKLGGDKVVLLPKEQGEWV